MVTNGTEDNSVKEVQPVLNEVVVILTKKRENLVSQINNFNKEIEQLRNEYNKNLAVLKEKQHPLQNALQHIEALLEIEGWGKNKNAVNQVSNKNNKATVTFIDKAVEVLQEANEPLHFKVIYEKIEKSGFHVPGKDGAATFLAKMSRDGRFKRIKKRGTYALTTWKVAKAKARNRKSNKSKGTRSK